MTTHVVTRPKVRAKEFHFPLTVGWLEGRRVAVRVDGKQPLEIMPPPELAATDPATWSPEDLFVGAAAACLAVTFTGIAEREGLRLESLRVSGDGVAGMRPDGRFGFTRLLVRMEVGVAAGDEERARRLAEKAEQRCLVSASLDVPVETDVVLA
jgi:organic hydroperoxide reductase OsmC/OhrA